METRDLPQLLKNCGQHQKMRIIYAIKTFVLEATRFETYPHVGKLSNGQNHFRETEHH